MKIKNLNTLDDGELFFAYVNTEDGKDLRSYFKGTPSITTPSVIHCECSTGDKWEAQDFQYYQRVWA